MRSQSKALFLLCLLFIQGIQQYRAQEDEPAATDSDLEIDGLSKEQRESIESNSEKHEFQAEVGRLMDIIINSLYTHKEVFLRELISNAADALDKIRFQSVANDTVLGDLPELSIRIEYDEPAKTISITDTGIGMTKQDLISNLGTIAKSGTTAFIEQLSKGGTLSLIGQFGVGFYSTFLAANKVTVTSKNNNDDQYIWESSAASSFSIIRDPRGNTLKRGTRVTLHLKQDAHEFCEQEKIKSLVKKYSEFINFPIHLKVKKEVTKEVPVEEDPEKSDEEDKPKSDDDLEIKEEDEEKKDKKPKTRSVRETVWDWELLNEQKPIWLRNKEDIEDGDYDQFYKTLTRDFDAPLSHIHFVAEGEVEFKSLLYIPKHAPYDLFDNYHGKSNALKLYVRRVLINEQFEDLMPRYLNFIKGIVDSDDLPLNVNRESLQQIKMLKVMSRKLVRKALDMIKELAESEDDEDEDEEEEDKAKEESKKASPEDKTEEERAEEEKEEKEKEKKSAENKEKYKTFWKEFGKAIKLGIIEDPGNRNKLAKLSRWYSSKNTSELISLDDYIERMKDGQETIYFIAGTDGKDNLMKSPNIQGLLKRNFEVLLLDDPIDEFCFQHLNEYEKKKLVNLAKGDIKLPEDDNEKKRLKALKKRYEPLTNWWKKILSSQLDSVIISQRLTDDPCVIIATEGGYSATMERISRAQAYTSQDKTSHIAGQKKILEINAHHPVIKELLDRVKESADSETEEMATLLFETALINSGYTINNPGEHARRFYKMFYSALGIPKDAQVEEIEIDLEEEEEKPKEEEIKLEDIDASEPATDDEDAEKVRNNEL